MKRITVIGLGLTLAALLALPALAANVKDLPGYFDLTWIDVPQDAAEFQDIDLSTVLLGVAADAEEAGDTDLATALSMVKSIRVKAFSTETTPAGDIDDMIQRITKQLKKDDWEQLISMKDDEERVTVSTKYRDGNMVGLMIVAYEAAEEVAFVNVVGDLDLATLMKLGLGMGELDLDDLIDRAEDASEH